jgi:hypothetical protein
VKTKKAPLAGIRLETLFVLKARASWLKIQNSQAVKKW